MAYDQAYQAEYRRRNAEKHAAYNRAWRQRPEIKERERERKRVTGRAHPAWHDVKNRVREGRLKRGDCVFCGKPNAHGHHVDYATPLLIVWACHAHHAAIHAGALKVLPEHITHLPPRAKRTRRNV